jgi:CheY-like chemotaxis protein
MDSSKLRILVLEDDLSLQEAIVIKLKSLGIETVAFVSGQEAIDYLKNLSSLSKLPNLIWLDYYLKDLNGLDFMRELKSHNSLVNIPVIVVSNSASPEKVKKMYDLGAEKYFLKADKRLDEIVEGIYGILKEKQESK